MKLSLTSMSSKIALTAAAIALACAGALAQAPEGPQPSPPPQASPSPAPKAAPQQDKPQEGGVTISVEVPVVTLDVIATTQNGDIIPNLKKENFKVLENSAHGLRAGLRTTRNTGRMLSSRTSSPRIGWRWSPLI